MDRRSVSVEGMRLISCVGRFGAFEIKDASRQFLFDFDFQSGRIILRGFQSIFQVTW